MTTSTEYPDEETLDPSGQRPCYEPDIGANLLQEILTWKKLELMQSPSVKSWLTHVQSQIAQQKNIDLIASLQEAIEQERTSEKSSDNNAAYDYDTVKDTEEDMDSNDCDIVHQPSENVTPISDPLRVSKLPRSNINVQNRSPFKGSNIHATVKTVNKKEKKKKLSRSDKKQHQNMVEKEMSLKALLFGGQVPKSMDKEMVTSSGVSVDEVQNRNVITVSEPSKMNSDQMQVVSKLTDHSERNLKDMQYTMTQTQIGQTHVQNPPSYAESTLNNSLTTNSRTEVAESSRQRHDSTSLSALDLATILSSESLKIDPSWQPMLDLIESAPTSPETTEENMSTTQSLIIDKLMSSAALQEELDTVKNNDNNKSRNKDTNMNVPQSRTSYRAQSAPTVQGNQRQHLMSPVEIMDTPSALKLLTNNNQPSNTSPFQNQTSVKYPNASKLTIMTNSQTFQNTPNSLPNNDLNFTTDTTNSSSLQNTRNSFDNFVVPPPPTSTFGVYTSQILPSNITIGNSTFSQGKIAKASHGLLSNPSVFSSPGMTNTIGFTNATSGLANSFGLSNSQGFQRSTTTTNSSDFSNVSLGVINNSSVGSSSLTTSPQWVNNSSSSLGQNIPDSLPQTAPSILLSNLLKRSADRNKEAFENSSNRTNSTAQNNYSNVLHMGDGSSLAKRQLSNVLYINERQINDLSDLNILNKINNRGTPNMSKLISPDGSQMSQMLKVKESPRGKLLNSGQPQMSKLLNREQDQKSNLLNTEQGQMDKLLNTKQQQMSNLLDTEQQKLNTLFNIGPPKTSKILTTEQQQLGNLLNTVQPQMGNLLCTEQQQMGNAQSQNSIMATHMGLPQIGPSLQRGQVLYHSDNSLQRLAEPRSRPKHQH